MHFLRVFSKTFGFLLALLAFITLTNILFKIIPNNEENFKFVEGDRNSNNTIAVINLNGPIINNLDNLFNNSFQNYIDPKEIDIYLKDLVKLNPKILVLRINSPGGSITATAALEKIIMDFKLKNKIKIYVMSDELLASGGYWVATASDKIFASYGSIIGSIGVSGPSWFYFNNPKSISSGLLGNTVDTENGIEIFDQNAGESKDLFNPFRKPTNKELQHLKNMVKIFYDDFVIKVSKSRKIENDIIKNDIGALIYTSSQAKNKFLIDEVLNYNELIVKIIKELDFKDYKLIKLEKNNMILKKYFMSYFDQSDKVVCQRLNSSFISLLPTFMEQC